MHTQTGENGENAQHRDDDAQNFQLLFLLCKADNQRNQTNDGDDQRDIHAGRQQMEQRAVGGDQSGVNQRADNRAGENVAEMTAGHGDGGEQLTHDIDGRQDEKGIQEALQIRADAGGLDLMVGNQHEHHQRPGKLRHQIGGGAPDTHKADQVGENAGDENRAHQRDVPVKIRPHVAPDEFHQGGVDRLSDGLLPGNARDLQSGPQPDEQSGDKNQNQPADNQRLGDCHRSEQRDVFKCSYNSRAIDFNFHTLTS